MDNCPDVSVIVPIYNVERYLPRCVESLLGQTMENIQIILVDDGSPDGSGAVADEYARRDSRITVIHQQNKWLGGARNSGLARAAGEYVCFVDADDYVAPDYCQSLVEYARKKQVDLLLFNLCHVDAAGRTVAQAHAPLEPDRVFTGDEARGLLYGLVIRSHALNSACMKLYRREWLMDHQLFFDEQIRYAEDYEHCLRLFPKVESFAYLDAAPYFYVENNQSIMHAHDTEIMNKLVILYRYREAFLCRQGLDQPENRQSSAELLLRMVVHNLPKYLGSRRERAGTHPVAAIGRICHNPDIRQALERCSGERMELGRYGRMVLWGLRHRLPALVYSAFLANEKRCK